MLAPFAIPANASLSVGVGDEVQLPWGEHAWIKRFERALGSANVTATIVYYKDRKTGRITTEERLPHPLEHPLRPLPPPAFDASTRARARSLKKSRIIWPYQAYCSRRKPTIIKLLLGVMSPPLHYRVRTAIRTTWRRWPSVGKTTFAIFVIGTAHLKRSSRVSRNLELERLDHQDVLLLRNATEPGGDHYLSISKVYGWWRYASAAIVRHGFSHVAKVDQDSFVHVPNLEAEVARFSCVQHSYYGLHAWMGYNPSSLTGCGFSWEGVGPYLQYGCYLHGHHPPIPFANGAIELLSSHLVHAIAASPRVAEFAIHAAASEASQQVEGGGGGGRMRRAAATVGSEDGRRRERGTPHEDVYLGFWLSRFPSPPRYVRGTVHNMGCEVGTHHVLTRRADPQTTVVVHGVKAAAHQYLWELLHDGREHDTSTCEAAL